MKLIDVKDTLPVGFIPIQETVDTRESALSMQASGAVSSSRWILKYFLCVFLWKHLRGFPVDGEESLSLVTSTLVICVSGEYVGPCLPVSRGTLLRMMPLLLGSLVYPQLLLKPSLAQDPRAKGRKGRDQRMLGDCTKQALCWCRAHTVSKRPEPERL